MTERYFLKPAEGKPPMPSPDHSGAALPDAGDWVNRSIYWDRRLAEVDVVDDTEAQLEREAAEAKAPKAKPVKEA